MIAINRKIYIFRTFVKTLNIFIMETILIQPKSNKELEFIREMLKRLGVKSKVLTDEEKENAGLVSFMKETDRTKKVSRNKIMKKLNK